MVRGGTWWVIPISGPSHRNVTANDLAGPDQWHVQYRVGLTPHGLREACPNRDPLSPIQDRPFDRRKPRRVPDGAGTAPAAPDQAALTSIILRVALGAGTRTSSMPFASLASTWAASTPSGSVKLRWNAPYATSRTK